MKHLILLPFLLLTVFAKAQDSTKTTTQPKWQIGVQFSPDITTGPAKNYTPNYTPSFGFATGFYASKKISKRFRLDVGIFYTQRNECIKDLIFSIDYRNGFLYDTLGSIKISDNYIEVPLKIKYQFDQRKCFNVFVTIGTSLNVLTKTSIYTKIYSGTTNEVFSSNKLNGTFGLNKLVPSIILGIGMEYKLSNNLNIIIQPEHRTYMFYGFNTLKTFTALGVNCGVSYNL